VLRPRETVAALLSGVQGIVELAQLCIQAHCRDLSRHLVECVTEFVG
jgi:hypothetical protein